MRPLQRPAIAVRPKTLTLVLVPALALVIATGCGHRRSAMRPVYVNPAPIVTTGPAPCPVAEPAPAFAEPGALSSPPAGPAVIAPPKTDAVVPQSGSDEPNLLPATPDARNPPPPLTGPSARRQSNRRSAVGPARRGDATRDRVSQYVNEPNDLFLPPKADRAWRYIVLHHSDHGTGSYAQIDRDHRDKLGTQGCGYHLVVGNGSESPDGQIEVARRWLDQKAGAHCRDATVPDANDYGIGICLIGDMDENPPTAKQVEATKALVAYLRDRYDIPAERVVSHAAIAQTATTCPGSKFPIDGIVNGRGFASR